MMCPIAKSSTLMECQLDQCAWWNKDRELCSVATIAVELSEIKDLLADPPSNTINVNLDDSCLEGIQKDLNFLANTLKR